MITTQTEVEEAIELCQFSKSQNPNLVTSREIAEAVLPQLSQELKERWIIERLMRITKRKRETTWAMRDSQTLTLPGMEALPKRIFLRNGRRPLLDDLTIGQVRDKLEMLKTDARKKIKWVKDNALQTPLIQQMEIVVELMAKYTPKFPKITWGKVKKLELEARSLPPPAPQE